jgi:hypothetical protein
MIICLKSQDCMQFKLNSNLTELILILILIEINYYILFKYIEPNFISLN